MDVSVILPTYNEKDNIVELIDEILSYLSPMNLDKEIVIVDDNSPDGTGEIVREHFAGNQEVKVFTRTEDKGFATAIRCGIEQSAGKVVAVMDTDFNHHPRMLPQMIKFLEFYDIVIASRFTAGGGTNDNFRYICSYLFNFAIRLMLLTRLQDNLSGFFAIRRERLFALNFDKIFWGFGDYFFRLLFYIKKSGATILDVPVIYEKRKGGVKKSNLLSLLMRYTKALVKLRFSG